MNPINAQQVELELLRRRGFTERQILRFCYLRRNYGKDEGDQLPLDRRHLEFARFLVATGRLSEQIG